MYFSIESVMSFSTNSLGCWWSLATPPVFRCLAMSSRAGSATVSYRGFRSESTLVFPTPSPPVITKRAIVF